MLDGSVESDTESCLEHNHQRPPRRLRLVWRLVWLKGDVASEKCAQRSDLCRIWREGLGSCHEELSALRQQRWSPLYVPMIWAAAGNEPSTPILDWLVEAAEQVREPVEFHGGQAVPSVCARDGFAALRGVLRSWRVTDRDDLSNWLGSQGFPRSTPGSHISARAQDFIFGEASVVDARCLLLEAVFVLVTLNVAREMTGSVEVPVQQVPPSAPVRGPPSVPSDFPFGVLGAIGFGESERGLLAAHSNVVPQVSQGQVAVQLRGGIARKMSCKVEPRSCGRAQGVEIVRTRPHCVAPQTQARRHGWLG